MKRICPKCSEPFDVAEWATSETLIYCLKSKGHWAVVGTPKRLSLKEMIQVGLSKAKASKPKVTH